MNSAPSSVQLAATRDPAEEQRSPYQTMLLVVSVVLSVPALQGTAISVVLERQLTDATVVAWGASLGLGSVAALAGSFWRGQLWDGLALERAGVALVGVAAAVYAGVVYAQASDAVGVAYVLGFQGAYAFACLWRVGQITRRLHWLRSTFAPRPSLRRRLAGRLRRRRP